MRHRVRQKRRFPGKLVVLQQPLPQNQPEMDMRVDDATARLIVAQKTLDRRMIAGGDDGTRLQPASQQDLPSTMLIMPRNKQIKVRRSTQNLRHTLRALPVTIRNRLPTKRFEDHQEHVQNGAVDTEADDRFIPHFNNLDSITKSSPSSCVCSTFGTS